MRVSVDVPFTPEPELGHKSMIDMARAAVGDVVSLDGLEQLEVVAVEPVTGVAKVAADRVLSGTEALLSGPTDITVTFEGPASDIQELVRRYEEGVR